jgi:Rrf2 family protein
MLKLTKKADYGLIAMRHLAEHAGPTCAKEIAEVYGIPPQLLAKILQRLVKAKLLVSQHGTNGGYALARDPRTISAFDVIKAIDGPLFITSCFKGSCDQTPTCTVREPLRKVNESIEEVLSRLTLWDMSNEDPAAELVALGTKRAEKDLERV